MGGFRSKTAGDYGRLVEAAVALAVARAVIAFAPFPLVARTTGRAIASDSPNDDVIGRDVVRAIERASCRLPWRCVCFDRGLAVQWMLRRRGLAPRLHFGVGSDGRELTAHVWVSLNGAILIGEDEVARHALVATFPECGA